jgi:hypothetical protein
MRFLLLLPAVVAAAGKTVLYATETLHPGNQGPRVTTTAFCKADNTLYAQLNCSDARMLLSYTNDTVLDFPLHGLSAGDPVIGSTAAPVAGNWSDLFDGALLRSLDAADLLHGSAGWNFWTGSTATGDITDNCNEWTAVASSCQNGVYGLSSAADATWIDAAPGSCNVRRHLICVCFNGTALGSASPTGAPTLSPTRTPSRAPSTSRPSASPSTSRPSASPSSSRPSRSPSSSSPSRSPSASPTPRPTSLPTRAPAVGKTYIFPGGSGTGALGNRAATTATCKATSDYAALVAAGKCNQAVALLCYSLDSDDIASMATHFSFSAAHTVAGADGTVIATDWASFTTGPLTNPITLAGIPSGNFWTGCRSGGIVSSIDCTNWSSASAGVTGKEGAADTTTTGWIGSATTTCDTTHTMVCACWFANPTAAPTFLPSKSPTLPTPRPTARPTNRPTTAAPTHGPVVVFSDATNRIPTFGNRAAANAICNGMSAFTSLVGAGKCTAGTATALVCYSSDEIASFPTNKGFSASLAVLSSTGFPIASSWSAFTNGPLSNSLSTASVNVGSTGAIITGCTTTGTVSTSNCQEFTVGVGLNFCSLGNTGSTSAGWLDGSTNQCSNTNFPLACVCWS